MVTGAVSDETAQTPSLSQRVPATQGTTSNTAGCALPRSRLPVLPGAPRPTLHIRNGVSRVCLTTDYSDALIKPEGPGDTNKKATLQQYVVDRN